MTASKLPASWQVTGTAETTQVDANGKFVQGILASFTTTNGHQGSVFLPLAQATPENVRAAIVARVQTLDQISSLTGGRE